jgi:hypothetical protein
LHQGIVGLHRGVVPVCRQAGTGKKVDNSFILRQLGEKSRKRQFEEDFDIMLQLEGLVA